MRHILARNKALQWTKSYVLPEFPYDVKCMLSEQKCPDHSMRIRIIEFLQADMTKYLQGSLWVITGQTCCLGRGCVVRRLEIIWNPSSSDFAWQIGNKSIIARYLNVCAMFTHVWRFCYPMNCSPPGSSVGFSRREYWSGLPFPPPGESSQPRDQTQVSCISCFTDGFFTTSGKPLFEGLHYHRKIWRKVYVIWAHREEHGLLELKNVLPVTLNRYPTTQQYNDVVNALLQAHPFLDEDGCGFVSNRMAPFGYSQPSLK